MKVKRWLYLIHRWLGVGMCLLMAMWFFSGVVMMYVGFPTLTLSERLAGLPLLSADALRIEPARLLASLDAGEQIESLRLTSIAGRPAYLLQTSAGRTLSQYADSGGAIGDVSPSAALEAARVYQSNWGIESNAEPTTMGLIEVDQWTVSRALNGLRPLYQVALNDAAGTRLYVSSKTGEVVRDTDFGERVWNWLGANLHWIYPLPLRKHGEVWHWVVVVLSLIGLVSIISGGVVGWWRLRLRKRYRGRDVTPYQGMMKWHHLLGLGCLLFFLTFMFSGLMSMNPWQLFTPTQSYDELSRSFRGERVTVGDSADFERLRDYLRAVGDIREVRWQWLDGTPYPVAIAAEYDYHPLWPAGWSEDDVLERSRASLLAAMRRIVPDANIVERQRLTGYDLYYYSHHQRWRPLPVERLRFDNADTSWAYLDLASGELLDHQTRLHRVQRWLYNGLHSLDFTVLIHHRPLWDMVVIVLSLFGLALSVTSVVIGWRRLVR